MSSINPVPVNARTKKLAHGRLKELLRYSQRTGEFTWLVRRGRAHIGDTAGCAHHTGYTLIGIDGVLHMAHRLAWLYVTGSWPQYEVDHKDGTKTNNKWSNLRDVTRAVNAQNQKRATARSTTGALGVCVMKGKLHATIRAHGTSYYLGGFETVADASAAYQRAKRVLHKEAIQ